MSRSFSSARLTLTRSVTPSPGTLQSQLSAIRMRVITRHSWLLRSTSVPAKFPRFEHQPRRNFCRDERARPFAFVFPPTFHPLSAIFTRDRVPPPPPNEISERFVRNELFMRSRDCQIHLINS